MKAGETVNDYFGRTLVIANNMRLHGERMEDVVIIEKILRSMTSKYDYVVCSIEESNDLDALSIDELQSSLLVHEQRVSRQVVDEQALQVIPGIQQGGRGGGRGSYCGRGRGRGRFGFEKSIIECYNCHELGHFQWEYPKKARVSQANFAETKEEMLLMAQVDVKGTEKEYTWFLDSGCSNHMSGNKEVFIEMDDSFRESAKLGNDSSLSVKGKGKVRIVVHGIVHVVTGVFFVSELKNNLLSIGQLQERGLVVLMQHGKCKIFHPKKGLILETEMTCNRMFSLVARCSLKEQKSVTMTTTDQATLWHYRYGHLSWNGLKMLQQRNMVEGLPNFKTSQKKIIVSRDVVFEEDEQWNWDDIHEQAILTDLEWETNEETIIEDEEGSGVIEDMGTNESHGNDSFEVGEVTAEDSASQEGRTRKPPIWMRDYETGDGLSDEESVNLTHLTLFTNGDPTTYYDAVKSEKWRQAMDREIEAIEKNDTWELTNLPLGGETIGVKWVFKTKLNENGEVDKYKARLVAKGYSQQYGVDFFEVFAPVA
ncbi:uncharacterized protein [Pyrus communis]|uniref:uncharacterized protein n=1 Tax=Pyrus communis TaxID=23211 RepID=UPI0035C197AE